MVDTPEWKYEADDRRKECVFLSVPVTLRVFELELSEATFGSAEDAMHCHDLQWHGLGGRNVPRMLCTLESSCLLDDNEEKEDDEDVEEDDKADISCKRFSLADQLLLVPFFFLDGENMFNFYNLS